MVFSVVIKNQKYFHIFFLPYFHSTFCPIRRFYIRHFVPFGVFPFDVLSRSAFFPFDVFSIRCFVPFGLLSHSTLVPFDLLSHSAFFPFDVLSHSAFCLSTFCRSTFCPFGVCDFDILSVNPEDERPRMQEIRQCVYSNNCAYSIIPRNIVSLTTAARVFASSFIISNKLYVHLRLKICMYSI